MVQGTGICQVRWRNIRHQEGQCQADAGLWAGAGHHDAASPSVMPAHAEIHGPWIVMACRVTRAALTSKRSAIAPLLGLVLTATAF